MIAVINDAMGEMEGAGPLNSVVVRVVKCMHLLSPWNSLFQTILHSYVDMVYVRSESLHDFRFEDCRWEHA